MAAKSAASMYTAVWKEEGRFISQRKGEVSCRGKERMLHLYLDPDTPDTPRTTSTLHLSTPTPSSKCGERPN